MRLCPGPLALGSLASALLIFTYSLGANAQTGVGARYGAREPAACASRAEPAQGAPTDAQAAQYVKCEIEGIRDGRLYLLEDVSVRVAEDGRPYDPQHDHYNNIDGNHPIYPISGSLVRFVCQSPDEDNAGRNCTAFAEENATGVCYKMVSGDWSCNMSDLRQESTANVAPPK